MDFGRIPLLEPDSPDFFSKVFAPKRSSKEKSTRAILFILEGELQPLGQLQLREQRAVDDSDDCSAISSSDEEGEQLTWVETAPEVSSKKTHSRKGSQSSTPKSSLCHSNSADGLDGDFIDIIGGGDGLGRHKERMSDTTMVDLEAERDLALLRAVKQLVLLNGPFDLCSLQSHLHARGLDSQILRWIFRSDFEHYSPTRRVHELVRLRGYLYVGNNQGGGRNLSWESFPAVAILSCMKDKSIPVDQARGLHKALASVKIVNGENSSSAVGVCLVEYANLSHTSLVVEGPLEGDPTILCRDLDALMRLADSKGKLALSSSSLSRYIQRI